MEITVSIIRIIHIAAGFISLIFFLIPLFFRKGGVNHIKTGKIYVFTMWVVVITAALLSIKNYYIGQYGAASFLGFIALITSNALYQGVAILKQRKGLTTVFQRIRLALMVAIISAASALIIYGSTLNSSGSKTLFFVFGALGLTEVPNLIRYFRKKEKLDRMKEHIVSMISSGIAAYTAFFVFGANSFMQQILPGMLSVIPWIAPGILGGFAIRFGVKHYRKKGLVSSK